MTSSVYCCVVVRWPGLCPVILGTIYSIISVILCRKDSGTSKLLYTFKFTDLDFPLCVLDSTTLRLISFIVYRAWLYRDMLHHVIWSSNVHDQSDKSSNLWLRRQHVTWSRRWNWLLPYVCVFCLHYVSLAGYVWKLEQWNSEVLMDVDPLSVVA